MKRAHRKVHRIVWLLLLPGLLALVAIFGIGRQYTVPSSAEVPGLDGDAAAAYQKRELP